MGWIFRLLKGQHVFGGVAKQAISAQKIKLKSTIKNSVNMEVFKFITNINFLLSNWSNIYRFSDFFFVVSNILDVYVNKLIWKWVKRRHPRRPNSWIYSKYWKNFLGKWKFFALNPITREMTFLNSHYISKKSRYSLPYSTNAFEYLDTKKLNKFFYKKVSQNIKGILRLLWTKQKGLCIRCKKAFYNLSLSDVKLSCIKRNATYIKYLAIVHSKCTF